MVLIIWIFVGFPEQHVQTTEQRQSIQEIFLLLGVRPVLFVLFLWIMAHNILYTYIAPLIDQVGLSSQLDLVLLIFGIPSVIGLWIVGLLIDRWLRILTLVSLAGFALSALFLGISQDISLLIYIGIALWGVNFWWWSYLASKQ